ncbi:(2Fe-2S)-binding protein [uncultured Shimia sp.]|uniref:(2Fe-2S)-binding protein n=1 Tax=uncultured Shimia sp. TaxID=573152 RepID=UPI002635B9D2|nr:(2Fe-2S)-binding protein [uncultured Shimia sp.]
MKILLNNENQVIPEPWRQGSLLFLLRDYFGLVGAKLGCGEGVCGACTVIVDGVAIRSCITSADSVQGARVETVEGLAGDGGPLHPVQQAWLDHAVPQCGYCQAGQIMSAVALLRENAQPTSDEVEDAMEGNLCRCGTYQRIRAAIHSVAEVKR